MPDNRVVEDKIVGDWNVTELADKSGERRLGSYRIGVGPEPRSIFSCLYGPVMASGMELTVAVSLVGNEKAIKGFEYLIPDGFEHFVVVRDKFTGCIGVINLQELSYRPQTCIDLYSGVSSIDLQKRIEEKVSFNLAPLYRMVKFGG